MVAGVIVLARIIGGIVLIAYLLVWFPMAFLVAVTLDEPLNLFGWVAVLINPVTIGLAAGLYTRAEQRKRLHG